MVYVVFLLLLFLALALSLFSTAMQTLKFSRKKDSAFLLFFFSFKVRVAMRFTAKMCGMLERQIFTPAYLPRATLLKLTNAALYCINTLFLHAIPLSGISVNTHQIKHIILFVALEV